MTIKEWVRKVLDVEGPLTRAARLEDADRKLLQAQSHVDELEKEVRECMKFIGAIFDYLEVRPQRTFIEDYSRLPPEERPTREVIKVVKASQKKR